MTNTLSSRLVTSLSLALAFALCAGTAGAFQEGKAKDKAKAKTEAAAVKVDVNNATEDELQELPQVGPANAKKIVSNRPYRTYKDLEEKAGLNTRVIDAIRGHIHFGAAEKAKTTAKPALKKPAAEEKAKEAIAEKAAASRAKAKEAVTEKAAAIREKAKKALEEKASAAREKAKETIAEKAAASREKAKPATAKPATTTASPKTTLPPGTKVNLNTATKEELDALPGIGPVKSQAIIDARPFAKIEDVMKVKGIKEGEFSKIKDMIKVK